MAVGLIETLAAQSTPWLLMVGLWKPHLPWRCPLAYVNNTTPFNGAFAGGATSGLTQAEYLIAHGNGCGEVSLYAGAPNILQGNLVSPSTCSSANQAYHATASYMMKQMEYILDALYASPAAANTHIVFMGDHGFHLGDHGLYCKHTNYEQATHTPLIFTPAPSVTGFARGQKAYAPVELLDIIPTIVELTNLRSATGSANWQGMSLVPLMKNPTTYIKPAAISQYFRGAGSNVKMGYSVRTVRYRLTRWCTCFLFL